MPVYREELSPTNFIERSAEVHAGRTAVIDGETCFTWSEFQDRSQRFASALRAAGLQPGDRVAFLALNSEPLLLAHFAVPLAGGVLVSMNTRLSSHDIEYIVQQSGSSFVFYSTELKELLCHVPSDIRCLDTATEFEAFVDTGTFHGSWNGHEDDLISINYTSGTTGKPKGVMYHHRGAYLNALAMALDHRLTADSVYLWTLPMFHCNGWTFPWALAATGAKSVCLARVDPEEIWRRFDEGVTHFCAAPTVLTFLLDHLSARPLDRVIRVFTAGAPPSPTLIARMADYNFELDHVYGLTETYGPFTIQVTQPETFERPPDEQARNKARQGFPNVCAGKLRVVDDQMRDVAPDGQSPGEVVMRGNVMMIGYFGDPEATEQAFSGGWFHSGDIGVRHADGSIELRDRKKDVIISGGENISTIEVEQAVCSHPAVLECAVIAIPDDKWGEVPKAFVTIRTSASVTEDEIISHCRERLAHFKTPKVVQFCQLPKTSTGKIQKHVLRAKEWEGRERRIN